MPHTTDRFTTLPFENPQKKFYLVTVPVILTYYLKTLCSNDRTSLISK